MDELYGNLSYRRHKEIDHVPSVAGSVLTLRLLAVEILERSARHIKTLFAWRRKQRDHEERLAKRPKITLVFVPVQAISGPLCCRR